MQNSCDTICSDPQGCILIAGLSNFMEALSRKDITYLTIGIYRHSHGTSDRHIVEVLLCLKLLGLGSGLALEGFSNCGMGQLYDR